MKSTIYIQNVTQIDFAYFASDYKIKGGSLNLSVKITGEVTEQEQVVIDFSNIKKTIKSLIDKNEEGFDHKLWIPDDVSYFEQMVIKESIDLIEIETPVTNVICPQNAIKRIKYESNPMGAIIKINHVIKSYLETTLKQYYPDIELTIQVNLDENHSLPITDHDVCLYGQQFNYVHGLKNSTSWGCQNMNHGHYSIFSVVDEDGSSCFLSPKDLDKILQHIDNKIYLWEQNITHRDNNKIVYEYETPRGYFKATYKDLSQLLVFETETTVENLTSNFVKQFKDELSKATSLNDTAAHAVYFSEGLTKGAYMIL